MGAPQQGNTNLQDAAGDVLAMNPDGSVNEAPVDGKKVTFATNVTGLAALAGILATLTGSGSKTIRVTRIEISGLASAASTLEFVLAKYSTAATGGTAGTVPTLVPMDSADAAATAVPAIYTAAPTAGTLVGNIRAAKINLGTSAASCQFLAWDFGNRPGSQALVLRGVTQQLGLTCSGTASGSSIDITLEFTEE